MATDGDPPDEDMEIEITDEEGLVDKKTKQHILNLRSQIDADERELFVNKATDPEIALSPQTASQYWAVSVRQYLRSIKRLWNDHDQRETAAVRNVDRYWRKMKIGEMVLYPSDTAGYQFSIIAKEGVTAADVREVLNLPRDADVPQPFVKEFNGLQSILETELVTHTWTVYTDKAGAPPNWEQVRITAERPVGKRLLHKAVGVADSFLQQAGLGFDVELPEYTGGNEPGL